MSPPRPVTANLGGKDGPNGLCSGRHSPHLQGAIMATIEKRTALDGAISYRVKVRLKGQPTQSASFGRLTDAKKWAAATESAIREGRHFTKSEAKRHTLADLIDRYARDVLPGKRDGKKQVGQLEWWKSELGPYTLADVTPAMIAEARDKLRLSPQKSGVTELSPATLNRYMAALSHAYTVAVKEWGWLDDSPMGRVTKGKESRGRVRFLSDEERAALLKECRQSSNQFIYPVVVLALSTGMRQGEIMGLYWREPRTPPSGAWGVVDVEAGRIVLHETKNGERRLIPMVGHALECVRELAKVRRVDTDLLFPSGNRPRAGGPIKPIDLRKPWETAIERAGIENFHFHDLRHSAASYLAMSGASLAEIAETLGHKTLQMVKRYSHLSEAHTASVVSRMNERIFGS